MQTPIFALVDCNNFYASCERIFNPSLEHKAIVVLSNNDGCIVARSNEAKLLGIPMGAPYFQYSKLLKQNKVTIFSSNYTLYGDISQRIMTALRLFCSDVEIYSIDEAFLQLHAFSQQDLINYCKNIRQKIKQWIGIPVSIGIAPTKTLAKVANYMAKRHSIEGIFDLRNAVMQETILKSFDIKNIWGIGQRLSLKLNQLGIKSALDLRDYPQKIIRQHFGVTVERTVLELRGIPCLSLEATKPNKSIIASRSFGKPITHYEDLAEAISYHTARASEKLRQQNSKAQGIYAFITTNVFRDKGKQYNNGQLCTFIEPTADTRHLIQAAKKALQKIYRTGYKYHKAGIILTDIISADYYQQDLFINSNAAENFKHNHLMQVIDNINRQMGKQTLFFAAQGTKPYWMMRVDCKSPKYTTSWQELVQVNAK